MNYYNEFDPGAAAWLRELIKEGHIPQGYVDGRSISEVVASDLAGFTQCHFFAGIGGWSYALKLAGIPATTKLWTGSPPCQPFSTAGKQLGQLDERHLAPTFMWLVDQCRPPILFGEQVAAAIGKHWLDDLFDELERQGYACGAAVLPACSVGAYHKRERLFFGAMADTRRAGQCKPSYNSTVPAVGGTLAELSERGDIVSSVADASGERPQGRLPGWEDSQRQVEHRPAGCDCATIATGENKSFWSDVDWLGCRDGKFRSVEPGTFPLADGIPARVGRLRGYGNAIVPQVAAEFIKAFYGAIKDATN